MALPFVELLLFPKPSKGSVFPQGAELKTRRESTDYCVGGEDRIDSYLLVAAAGLGCPGRGETQDSFSSTQPSLKVVVFCGMNLACSLGVMAAVCRDRFCAGLGKGLE